MCALDARCGSISPRRLVSRPCGTFPPVHYWPNPAHKLETTEAGTPAWTPNKEKCPRGMTVEERDQLFAASVPVDGTDPRSRRFAIRRTNSGLEVFDIKWGRDVDGDPEFHGHPAWRIDRGVLKILRDRSLISAAELNRLRKELPGC